MEAHSMHQMQHQIRFFYHSSLDRATRKLQLFRDACNKWSVILDESENTIIWPWRARCLLVRAALSDHICHPSHNIFRFTHADAAEVFYWYECIHFPSDNLPGSKTPR